MSRIFAYFARGCLALIPVAATIYILWWVITTVDELVGVSIPGLGLVIGFALVTLVGFLISNVIGRGIYQLSDRLLERLPLVKLLYTSLRDLIQTFVGDKKSLGKPVSVLLSSETGLRVFGFLTRDDLSAFALPDHVAVYVPQSYNIGGQVLTVHRSKVEPLEVTSPELLTFLVSGGAAGLVKSN